MTPLPGGLSAPARRALDAAGIDTLEAAAGRSRRDVAALHGMGPRALTVLDAALADAGLGWA